MKKNKADQIVVDENDFIEILHREAKPLNLVVDDSEWIEAYKKSCDFFEIPANISWEPETKKSREDYIRECLHDWNLPEKYKVLDLEKHVLDKCVNAEQRERVKMELREFESRDMMKVLKFLKYFVDTLQEKDMIWGVGRGSSVASYVLYLLGVHRVDTIDYELDIGEFLK